MNKMDINELHQALLRLLIKFDTVCREYNITYSIAFGTMLGAIRNKGFIPWDDDVDIMITRKEYEKLCNVPSMAFEPDFFFQTVITDKGYPYNTSRLRLNNTSMIFAKWNGVRFHQGIYIDIIVLDNIPTSKLMQTIQKLQIILLTPFRFARNSDVFFNCGKNIPLDVKRFMYSILKRFPLDKLYKIEVEIESKYKNICSEEVCFIGEGNLFLKKWYPAQPIPSETMKKFVYVPFENITLMCSASYDLLLKTWYGDYMKLPPEEEREVYHQPIFFSSTICYLDYLKWKSEQITVRH